MLICELKYEILLCCLTLKLQQLKSFRLNCLKTKYLSHVQPVIINVEGNDLLHYITRD